MSIIVLDSNANSREILKSFLEELGLKDDLKLFADYFSGVAEIKSQQTPPIVFVDISNETPDLIETVKNIRLLTDKIVITSTDYSTDTIVKAMRLGAREFLPKPVIKNDLIRVVEMLSKPEAELEITASKIITVYSNKGGIGKTTIASNLAAEIAKTTHDKVALVDLNLQLGDISTFLNLNPSFDVAYVDRKSVV